MTQNRRSKRAIRSRMADTGEKYTEARRALLASGGESDRSGGGSRGPEPIEEARRASDLTMDYETASVAWSAATSWQGWGAIDGVMSKLMSGDGRGVADFRTGGCLLTGSKLGLGLELYFGPGFTMVRRQHGSRWHDTRERSARGSAAYTPVWVVELPRGVTEAAVSERETVDGAPCRRLTVRCDPNLAAERSRHGMQIPDHPSVPAELWIDSSGCLRRIRVTEVFQEGESHEAGLVTELRLSDLGTATAPAPPRRTAAQPAG